MSIPAYIMLTCIVLNIVVNVVKDGQARDNYNGWRSVVDAGATAGILYWGGFFS